MSRLFAYARPLGKTGVVCALLLLGTWSQVVAQTEGQSDLDEATQLKLNAQSMADLERVVELCESALQKGLDDESGKLAKSLMTATLYQHASRFSQAIFNPRQPTERWRVLKQFAMRDLDKALKYDDNLPQVHILVARLEALQDGDREKGKRSADRAVELLADDKVMRAQALVVRASYQPDMEKGFADLDKAIELDPSNIDARRVRGLTHLAQSQQLIRQNKIELAKKEQKEALDDFMKLLEENPQDLRALQAVAELLGNLGDFEQALTHLENAITLNPQSPSAYRLRARIYNAQQKHDEALLDLNRAFDLKPDDYEVLLERSRVHFVKGDHAAARADVDRALEIEPNLLQAVLQRSLVSTSQGKYEDAIRDLKRVIEAVDLSAKNQTTAPDPRLRLQLGNVYVLAEQPAKAIEVFDEILEKDPKNTPALLSRADAYVRVQKYDGAIADLQRVMQASPDARLRLQLENQLGNIYIRANRPLKAIDSFGAVLEKDSRNTMALRGRADAFLSIGKQAEAIADYETAYGMDPEDGGVLNNLAWVLATSPKDELRDAERAIKLATKACEVTEYRQAHILSTLAAACAEAGDFDKAIEWSTKAVELDKAEAVDQKNGGIEEQLRKELESYKQKTPWRELQEIKEEGSNAPQDDDLKTEDEETNGKDTDAEPASAVEDGN